MNMGTRIRELRKSLGLTQQEFADRLGVKRTNIACYETGKNELTDAVVSLICREFRVNEAWLRTGGGEMIAAQTRDEEIAEAIDGMLSADRPFYDMVRSILTTYSKLDGDARAVLDDFIDSLAENQKPAE